MSEETIRTCREVILAKLGHIEAESRRMDGAGVEELYARAEVARLRREVVGEVRAYLQETEAELERFRL